MIVPDHVIRWYCTPEPERSFSGKFEDGDPNLPIFNERVRPRLVEPYDPDAVQPASYDMRLGNDFRVFTASDTVAIYLSKPESFRDLTKLVHVEDDEEFVLHPGEFVLGRTLEVVTMPDVLVGRVEGKSSLGRLGLIVHATAGFVDPGFQGAITLEMTNLLRVPIVMQPGQSICQMAFTEMAQKPEQTYSGRYQGDQSVAASRYGQ